MMVPIEKVFLRNKNLEAEPWHQRESPFYKKVRDSMKEKGMINIIDLKCNFDQCKKRPFFN